MKKMKRISYIVNPQGVRTEAIIRKEERIDRQIDQAIAAAQDQAAEAKEQADAIVDKFGENSGIDGTAGLQAKINKYLEFRDAQWGWNRQVEYLKELKASLSEEVEVTVTPTVVRVEKDA